MESQEEMPRQQVQLESTQSAKSVSEDQIRSALKLLFEPGQVVELRVLRSGKSVVAGYFNDPEKLVLEAARWSGNASSVCITLNLIDPNSLHVPKIMLATMPRISPAIRKLRADAGS